MPLVHVELIEGRSQEQLKQLVADITDAVKIGRASCRERV